MFSHTTFKVTYIIGDKHFAGTAAFSIFKQKPENMIKYFPSNNDIHLAGSPLKPPYVVDAEVRLILDQRYVEHFTRNQLAVGFIHLRRIFLSHPKQT